MGRAATRSGPYQASQPEKITDIRVSLATRLSQFSTTKLDSVRAEFAFRFTQCLGVRKQSLIGGAS